MFKDLFARIRDIVGGRSGKRSGTSEEELRKVRDIAIDEMVFDAEANGANAVIGVDLDGETINGSKWKIDADGAGVGVGGEDQLVVRRRIPYQS